jgi:hypothetical protein|tara:strand:- start:798 stop:1589 length:792 start_codon:yes stop_codon:yes gene_type:complete
LSKIPNSEQTLELLINCKTYPAISKKYIETVCTGGVQVDGTFVRLYPIPFRFLEREEQYKRWDIIQVRAYKDTKDRRPESWHLIHGTPINIVKSLTTDKQRWEWMNKAVFQGAEDLESQGKTNGLVEIEPIEFYWQPDKKEWTPSQIKTLSQGSLFDSKDKMAQLATRVPWQFRLKYREKVTGREDDGKVLAWSNYQGYLRFSKDTGDENVALEMVADKVRRSIFSKDKTVYAILGTHSRFGHWMISGLYHLPTKIQRQGCLL